ncbi:uncharacterized protein RSE6_13154 [Rhynchosporium secalis]|uniref:Mid2 domain-containing protein n=1 Tax=Rhynchosporium secalis TaxID=38038 RepID=A0A1E1MS55_RHYSE|nr:uncharacterized protein RSE6_13154 [Rhynchosporium secalis]
MVSTYLLLSTLSISQAIAFVDGLQNRAIYQGSWALAIPGSSCPEDVSVTCKGVFRQQGVVLLVTLASARVLIIVVRVRMIAEPMYPIFPPALTVPGVYTKRMTRSITFAVSPQGQYGVLPIGNYGGICQYNDVPVAASKIATLVDQVGTSSISRPTRTATMTSTRSDGATVIVTQILEGTATKPPGTNPTSSASSSKDNQNQNSSDTSPSNKGLSAGAIAGIVIGSLGVLALFLVAFMLYRRNSKKTKTEQASRGPNGGATDAYASGMPQGNAPNYTAVPQQNHDINYPILVTEIKSPLISAASPAPGGYSQSPPHGAELQSPASGNTGPYEAPTQPQWEGRAELFSYRA